MDLTTKILKEHSKSNALAIVDYIGDDEKQFAELIALFLGNTYKITQRAAWIVGFSTQKHPKLIAPHLEKIVSNLRNNVHDAVKRNTLKILAEMEIPEKLFGEVADICFGFLAAKGEAVAIKSFSIKVLYQISLKEPDLQNELRFLIEQQMPFASAGFVSIGKKVLKAIS